VDVDEVLEPAASPLDVAVDREQEQQEDVLGREHGEPRTGSLGFEALSRGAAGVTFVDNDRSAVKVIRENASVLRCADACDIVQADAVGFISRNSGIFGLIFADPPYAFGRIAALPGLILASGLLAEGGYLIVEHRRGTGFAEDPPAVPAFTRTFGGTDVSFFQHTDDRSRSGA